MSNKLEEIFTILQEVKEGSLDLEQLNPNTSIVDEVALDSLQMISFMLKVEEKFGIEIDFDSFDFSYLSSIQAFYDYITQRG